MQPRRISILGVGLLGGSIGLAVKSRLSGSRVVGYAHRPETLDAALKAGALDEGYGDLGRAVAGADLVILCTPVGMFEPLLAQLSPLLKPGALVSDVGSTKRSVVRSAEELLPPGIHFVGSHPMAGSEKKGVQFARADLYEGALCILTPTPKTDPQSLERIEVFWAALGMRTCRISPEEHDRRLAAVSHLPHALAAALVAMQDPASLALAGKGFADMTRIAGGDGALWRDIFLDNRDNVADAIRQLQAQLEHVLRMIEGNQAEALEAWLDRRKNIVISH